MSDKLVQTPLLQQPLAQRIVDLQARKPAYINHGEALMLQRIASDSLRAQLLTEDRITLDD
ncbi:hypothetical protein [Ruegeria halocynthiae]|uniref:hypothetical protein n=1 Tax=Ruegeria halocynthiae TaxID=985054 RepID=UPI00056880CC|nr:hypothetical protein [Ruegeria halocynthiae]